MPRCSNSLSSSTSLYDGYASISPTSSSSSTPSTSSSSSTSPCMDIIVAIMCSNAHYMLADLARCLIIIDVSSNMMQTLSIVGTLTYSLHTSLIPWAHNCITTFNYSYCYFSCPHDHFPCSNVKSTLKHVLDYLIELLFP